MSSQRLNVLSRSASALLLIALSVSSLPAGPAHAAPGDLTRVSVSSSEAQGDSYSRHADISADGRFIAFYSDASSLVVGDTNGMEDVFVRDVQQGETARVSLGPGGAQGDNGSYYPAISADGRFVAFMSDAGNLVIGDTNGVSDIFVHDREAGTTTRVSVGPGGVQSDGPSNSYVAVSADGRFVAFASEAANLVSGDTNGVADLFVRDRQAGVTERVSLDSGEVQANEASSYPSVSADGQLVAFSSSATNLVGGDTNAKTDVFVRDRAAGTTARVSVSSSGAQADRGGRDASISADGRYVAFSSDAYNLLDEEPYGYPHVYVHDRQSGATALVSSKDGYQMVGWSTLPDISADGRYVAFEFDDKADGLGFVAIYVHDRLLGLTAGISGGGGSEEDSSFKPAISADGLFAAFGSHNSHLVPDDTNGVSDIFRRELAIVSPATQTLYSAGAFDGWVIESGEENETGLRIDQGASTFFLGDANNDQQYRSILHFDTGALPNTAIITAVTLRIKRQGIVGTNPFTTHNSLLVDIRKPHFGASADLEPADFQAAAGLSAVGSLENLPGGLWYTARLDPSALASLNLSGPTQLRLRFALDDNDDSDQDYMKFFSGDAAADPPELVIEYYAPTAGSPRVLGIWRADASPTSAASVRFTVAFSEPVTGVDAGDFHLVASPEISGAAVEGVSGSGDTYTVSVDTGSGEGTLRLDLIDDNSILDANSNRLVGAGTSDGSFSGGESYTIARSTFADVPSGYWAADFIERLYAAGITGGCGVSPLRYCPEGTVTRGQMAVFLLRGIHGASYVPPEVAGNSGFADVPPTYWSAAFIKQLAAEGITAGCGGGDYCPEAPVNRAQMAVFLLRSKYGAGYTPPSVGSSTGFGDVPASHWAAAFIKQLVAEGITAGCGSGDYCPEAPVSRAQMAVFLVRTFGLP